MGGIEGIVALSIPILSILILGIVIVTIVFFRSRERQMLIEKGLDAQSIKDFFERKKDPFILLKIGIIILAFGLGLGLGLLLHDMTSKEYWIPLLIISFTGLGFILASLVGKKMENKSLQ